jgi:hypothetical protein
MYAYARMQNIIVRFTKYAYAYKQKKIQNSGVQVGENHNDWTSLHIHPHTRFMRIYALYKH